MTGSHPEREGTASAQPPKQLAPYFLTSQQLRHGVEHRRSALAAPSTTPPSAAAPRRGQRRRPQGGTAAGQEGARRLSGRSGQAGAAGEPGQPRQSLPPVPEEEPLPPAEEDQQGTGGGPTGRITQSRAERLGMSLRPEPSLEALRQKAKRAVVRKHYSGTLAIPMPQGLVIKEGLGKTAKAVTRRIFVLRASCGARLELRRTVRAYLKEKQEARARARTFDALARNVEAAGRAVLQQREPLARHRRPSFQRAHKQRDRARRAKERRAAARSAEAARCEPEREARIAQRTAGTAQHEEAPAQHQQREEQEQEQGGAAGEEDASRLTSSLVSVGGPAAEDQAKDEASPS